MYIGSTGPTGLHHLVWEVVDNSVDEAMAGYCTRIDVTLQADGSCEVRDDGRGIPVGRHPKYEELSAAEVVLTKLHAGGKFGGHGYKVSGGLHGVGVSVVNALSSRVEVEIDREGTRYYMDFADGGELKTRLEPRGDSPLVDGEPVTGTTVRFWPDPTVFDETQFRFQTLLERFQMMAFLNRGLEIRTRDLREGARPVGVGSDADSAVDDSSRRDEGVIQSDNGGQPWTVFCYEGGIIDFVRHVNAAKEALFDVVGYLEGADEFEGNAQEVEVAFQWNTAFNTDGLHSFANGIATIEGGMHEQGFRTALTRTINFYAREKNLLKEKDDNLQGDDIREGLSAIISVRVAEPQFEGQTKSKLGNVSVRSLVERATNERPWPSGSRSTRARPRRSSPRRSTRPKARVAAAKKARKAIRSKSAFSMAPGCPTSSRTVRRARTPPGRELFIVEGDSAGGSAVGPAIPRPRRSCRSGARSSTSSAPASTRCSRTTRSRP